MYQHIHIYENYRMYFDIARNIQFLQKFLKLFIYNKIYSR